MRPYSSTVLFTTSRHISSLSRSPRMRMHLRPSASMIFFVSCAVCGAKFADGSQEKVL